VQQESTKRHEYHPLGYIDFITTLWFNDSVGTRLKLIDWRSLMNMQEHILAALREQFDLWEATLAGLSEEQVTTPLAPSDWSIKDNVVHLWAWQLRSIARMEAALNDREPVFPAFLSGVAAVDQGNVDDLNAQIYETYRLTPWPQVHRDWRTGRLKFMELGGMISERELLDGGKYPWLGDLALADLLLGSYDHHLEHLEELLAWLERD
jgi:hypothetical protein